MNMFRTLLFLLTPWSLSAKPEDLVLHTEIESSQVKVDLFIPKEARPVRGLLIHAAHYQLKTTGRWPTLCRELGFAHLVTNINLKLNNRPRRLREAMNAALQDFAKTTGKPELTQVPRVGVGMSAGGMCIPMLMEEPDKLLTNAVSCSWVTDPAKIGPERARIPEMYVIGAKPDGFKMLPAIDNFYVPSVKAGNPWALGLQHECKHDWANSGTLFVPWIRGIAALRIPENTKPGEAVPLKPVSFQSGWRGDRSTIKGQFATVVPYEKYQGDPAHTVWLPDRATAYVWRAWQTKNASFQITAETSDKKKKLPKFKPRSSFGMSVTHGQNLALGIQPLRDGPHASKVVFYAEDQILGSPGPDGIFHWKNPSKRAHAIWAEYEIDDQKAATNPALICVEEAAK
jgi:hypothetical protein